MEENGHGVGWWGGGLAARYGLFAVSKLRILSFRVICFPVSDFPVMVSDSPVLVSD